MRADEIAKHIGGRVVGDPARIVRGVNSLELAGPDDLSFIVAPKNLDAALQSKASCLIAPDGCAATEKTLIIAANPKAAFAAIVGLFHAPVRPPAGIHPSAVIDPSAVVSPEASIGPQATIGAGARIGARASLGASVAVGAGTLIGDDTIIHPNVTIYPGMRIGARCIIHAGVVIGSDGFGFVMDGGRYVKIPQLGTVLIEDDVEIGANCTIDRATFGSTVIKRGTKLDNLVHIAHNVTVGEHATFSAQVGVAGSSTIGNYVVLGGQVGVADHADIGDKVVAGGQAGIITNQHIKPGEVVWGTPARPVHEAKRQIAALAMLPKLLKDLRQALQGRAKGP